MFAVTPKLLQVLTYSLHQPFRAQKRTWAVELSTEKTVPSPAVINSRYNSCDLNNINILVRYAQCTRPPCTHAQCEIYTPMSTINSSMVNVCLLPLAGRCVFFLYFFHRDHARAGLQQLAPSEKNKKP